jgi:hypothetical protein
MSTTQSLKSMDSAYNNYSPTTVFAVDVHSVFRATDATTDTTMNIKEATGIEQATTKHQQQSSSFMTDEELSTFSEDDDEDIVTSAFHHSSIGGFPMRRSALSIFRPVMSGTKRHRSFMFSSSQSLELDEGKYYGNSAVLGASDEVDGEEQPMLRSTQVVCRANPINDSDEDDTSISSRSSTSSFKRIRRSSSSTLAETLPSKSNVDEIKSSKPFALTPPQHLQHPLSFVSCRATSSPIFDANCIGVNDKNDEKKE